MRVWSSKLGRVTAWRLALACLAWAWLSCLGWLVLQLIRSDFHIFWISLSGLAWPGLSGPCLIWFEGWSQFLRPEFHRSGYINRTSRQEICTASSSVSLGANYQRPGRHLVSYRITWQRLVYLRSCAYLLLDIDVYHNSRECNLNMYKSNWKYIKIQNLSVAWVSW